MAIAVTSSWAPRVSRSCNDVGGFCRAEKAGDLVHGTQGSVVEIQQPVGKGNKRVSRFQQGCVLVPGSGSGDAERKAGGGESFVGSVGADD